MFDWKEICMSFVPLIYLKYSHRYYVSCLLVLFLTQAEVHTVNDPLQSEILCSLLLCSFIFIFYKPTSRIFPWIPERVGIIEGKKIGSS